MLLSRHTRRREFVGLAGGTVAWPLAARAQQPARIRRVGVSGIADDQEGQVRENSFREAMVELGWVRIATCTSTTAGREVNRR